MAKTILNAGEANNGEGAVYSNHIMLFAKALGSGESIDVQVADSKDDLSADASWVSSGTVLDDEVPVKPFFTSKGIAVRVVVEGGTAGSEASVVVVDILNEPAEYIRGSLGS